jgi:hypothetical protein
MVSKILKKLADPTNLRYLCKTCKAMFWSYQDVVFHKGFTGHGEYETSPRDKPLPDGKSEA